MALAGIIELQIDDGRPYLTGRNYDIRFFDELDAMRDYLERHNGEFRFRLRDEPKWQTAFTERWFSWVL